MHKIIALSFSLALAGCGTFGLLDPWAGGSFDPAVWKADLAKVKAAAQTGGQAALDAMDALCPSVSQASAVVNDPTYVGPAQSVFGVNGATKAINNINDGLSLLADACNVRNAATAQAAIVRGAQAITDAKRIFAAKAVQ
jgi:hypothetical protein